MRKKRNTMPALTETLGSYLKTLRESSKFSLEDVKNRTGISKSSLSDWENDKYFPKGYNLEKLANFYNIDDEKFNHLIHLMGIPIYDRAHISLSETPFGITKHFSFSENIFNQKFFDDYYFTKKEDDSMDLIGILVGSYVLFRKTNALKSGDIGIFTTVNEALMREIQFISDTEALLIPHSSNPEYKTLKYNLADIKVIAKVEKVIIDFNNQQK